MRRRPTRGLPLILGVSGASGALYGVRAAEIIAALGLECHLVVSRAAARTLELELPGDGRARLFAAVSQVHDNEDLAASIASGSFRTRGMLVAPCSVRTLSAVAHGDTGTLMVRAADVALKERRRLVLMVRETPLHLGHIRAMQAVTEMGGIIVPPVPAFYARPATLQDIVDQSVARALELFGLDVSGHVMRWSGAGGAEGGAVRKPMQNVDPGQ